MLRRLYNRIFKRNQYDINNERIMAEINNTICDLNHLNTLNNLENFDLDTFYKKLINLYPEYIKYIGVNFQTLDMCENVVKVNPDLIKYCKYQTIDMCEFVVSKKPYLIKYTFYQTVNSIKRAVYYDISLIKYVTNQTIDICMYVVLKEPYYFKHVKVQNLTMCKYACSIMPYYIKYCMFMDEDLCIDVADKDITLIKFIPHKYQTKEMVEEIFKTEECDELIKYVNQSLLIKLGLEPYYKFIYNPDEFKIDNVCPICLEEFKHEDHIINSLCKHYYHSGCLTEWLSIKKSCPMCNSTLG